MKEQLEVKNFGPLKDLTIELKPVMVFIGAQATGKSAIAKLISIFRTQDFIIEQITFEGLLAHHNITSFVSENTFIKFTSESHVFTYQHGKASLDEVKDHNFTRVRHEYQQSLEDERETTPISGDYFNELIELESYSVYIPSERILIPTVASSMMNLIKNRVPLPENLMFFGAEYEQARAALKELDLTDILQVIYKFENGEDRIYMEPGRYVPLKATSSGFQTLIPMLAVIEYKTAITAYSGHTFILEEPELNLYPSAQKALIRKLIRQCCYSLMPEKLGHELVITTHSLYILSSLNNQLFANSVALKNAGKADKINAIIPKECWIDGARFAAYSVENGSARSIVDPETGLISETELESALKEITSEFNALKDFV